MDKDKGSSSGATSIPPPYSTTADGQNQASTLGKLWSEAIATYERKTNQSLRLGQMKNLDEVIKGTEKETKRFGGFRHDKGWIQKVVKIAEVAGKAAGAFPPAMPAGLIFCAFGQVMNSFNDMSADYDKVLDFFAFVGRFFERLSIIEDRTPNSPGFLKAVVYVFTNMLDIFAIAQMYSKEQGRFKKWFLNLVDGEDPDLKKAYNTMEMAVNELSDAVGMETLRTTAFIADVIHKMDKDMEGLVSTTTRIDVVMGITRATTEILVEKSDVLVAKADNLAKKIEEMMARANEKSLITPNDNDVTKYHPKRGKTDPGEKRRVALAEVKGNFKRFYPGFDLNAGSRARSQENSRIEGSIDGTGQWIFEEENYKGWASTNGNDVAWIEGGAGIGKSFLSQTIAMDLEKTATNSSFCASFSFKEGQDGLTSFNNSLCCLSIQIAEKNPNYLEELASALDTSIFSSVVLDLWKTCFTERFPSKGDAHTWLVLDGVDEMNEMERKGLMECLAKISSEDLNIHVLLTARSAISDEILTLNPLVIHMTKEKIETDIEQFVLKRMEVLPHLRKFRKSVKSRITNKLKRSADDHPGILYVEHILRRLNYIGREKAVVKDLDRNLPHSLQDLYSLMLDECQSNITAEQCRIAKELFAWMAYSKRTLTREEAAQLCAISAGKEVFDVEDLVDEINGRSARILEFNRSQEDEEDLKERADDKTETSDAEEPGFHMESGKTPLEFQERSLREYFRVVKTEKNGLQTQPSTAHLAIFETCGSLLLSTGSEIEVEKRPKLLEYAAKYFADHLMEIDINSTSDDDAHRVVVVLYKILTNFNNFALVIEGFGTLLYSEMAPNGNGSWIDVVKKWAGRALSLDENVLGFEIAQWAKETITSEQPLMSLARGHVLSSFKAFDGFKISRGFDHARDIFQLSGFDVKSDSLETVLTISTHFTDTKVDAGSYRAIAATLARFELPQEAIKYVDKAFDILPPGNSSLRFYLTRSMFLLAVDLAQEGNELTKKEYENPIRYIDQAISVLPLDWRKSEDLADMVEDIYHSKAEQLKTTEKLEDAIQAYEDLRAVRPDKTVEGFVLQLMVQIWEENDPEGTRTLKMIKGWTESERLAWFAWIFGWPDFYATDAIVRFDQVAAKNGEEGKKFILQCYRNYTETLTSKSAQAHSLFPLENASSNTTILVNSALANTYRCVLRDDKKAKEIYTDILKHQLRGTDLDLEQTFFESRRALAEIMFEEFRGSNDPMKKAKLLHEMKDYLTPSELNRGVFKIESSNASIIFAIMHRALGSATEFESILKKTFDTCIQGLSDTVGWNDSSSFRLLSKVLACVEGMERDSLIALSCMYSKVTEEAAKETVEVITEMQLEETINLDTPKPEPESSEAEKKNGTDGVTANTPVHLTETTISTSTMDDGVLTSNTKTIIEEATFSPEKPDRAISQIEADDSTTSEDRSNEAIENKTKPYALSPIPDEDKLPSVGQNTVGCDGGCGSAWTSWEEPQYLCIVCTNIDLCTICHEKRISMNSGGQSGYWRPYCGYDHRYIKGPIEGWRGVKDGEIRIMVDGKIEKIKLLVWLNELDGRWNQAWDKFWRRLEGVKNIGF
ncbi:hypothetical protein HYFRA_00004360 [Hymenoscyphus fraxineus]|uniref:NACHT domain-containing protein n=1 Tax=Hymenoscyphus fraxineus TaxID=746836 RepID=A0A9N9KN56_9HELO|nr:hypothetical protein HYFRA_00004360 [Hymenoscyphus fraxineus]